MYGTRAYVLERPSSLVLEAGMNLKPSAKMGRYRNSLWKCLQLVVYISSQNNENIDLRIDNSCHGMNHVLWYISRTTIATASFDISNERAHYSVCLGANGSLMTFYPKKQKIKDIFVHFYILNINILLNNELTVMKLCTDVKTIHMEGTMSQIFYLGLSFNFI